MSELGLAVQLYEQVHARTRMRDSGSIVTAAMRQFPEVVVDVPRHEPIAARLRDGDALLVMIDGHIVALQSAVHVRHGDMLLREPRGVAASTIERERLCIVPQRILETQERFVRAPYGEQPCAAHMVVRTAFLQLQRAHETGQRRILLLLHLMVQANGVQHARIVAGVANAEVGVHGLIELDTSGIERALPHVRIAKVGMRSRDASIELDAFRQCDRLSADGDGLHRVEIGLLEALQAQVHHLQAIRLGPLRDQR